ncbi:MAG TPA: PPC domain-containing protein, partial [Armatimonadota bacterium]|nr:PPC domain-containing protein [Armatimonadota bacterium]
VARGASTQLTLYGWNLAGKTGRGSVALGQAVPADAGSTFPVRGAEAPNTLLLPVADTAETAEAEPNDNPQTAPEVALPLALHGEFGARGDTDCFRFAAKKGEVLRIAVAARELDSLADPQITLRDASGKALLSEDDAERTRDARTVWTVPEDGVYTLVVSDLAGGSRGGPSSYYRLSIAPVQPELTVVAGQPMLLVKPGEKAEWTVTLYQSWQPQEITLRVEGLPAGVTAEPVRVPPLARRTEPSRAKLVLTAAPDAQPAFSQVRIVATTGGETPRTLTAVWMLTGDGGVPLGTGSTSALVVLVPTK